MKKATGMGGVFFKVKDVPAIKDWYRDTLGFKVDEWGAAFTWGDVDPGNKHACSTAWSPFKEDSKHFAPSTFPYMFNYRVHDLKSLIDGLRNEGVEVVGGIDEYDYGKFAWIMDPEGRKIELWEPIDSGFGEAQPPWTGKVIGLKGIFFKSEDPAKMKEWYKKHLGIDEGFLWRELTSGEQVKIDWAPLDKNDNVFKDTNKPYVFAYYTRDPDTTLSDPDGNKVLLKH